MSLKGSLFRGTSHNNIAISLPALLFFRSYNEVFVRTAFIPYYLSTDKLRMCTVHSTVPGPRIGNVLTISSRDNHIASLSEMSVFTCSRMRILTTISCAPESASQGDLLVIENSEPPQGARVLTDEQSRLTPTDANG